MRRLSRRSDSCLVAFTKRAERDLQQMLHTRRDKARGAPPPPCAPPLAVTGLSASLLACQEGTSVFWHTDAVLLAGEAIGSRQPSEAAACVAERDGDEGGAGGWVGG